MQKQCKQCLVKFEITQKDLDFYNKISPVFDWKKYSIPSPTLCYNCRQQRKLTWRNERKLYKRKCDSTWEEIISIYSPNTKYIIYKNNEYFSDKWNAFDYWVNFDFNKSFFEQFDSLHSKIPKPARYVFNSENCEYTNFNSYNKNCYLIVAASENEDCYYSSFIYRNNNIVDCNFVFDTEIAYECIDCYNSYKLFYSQSCDNCSDSYFLHNCQWCKNCYWCVNLSNKQYYIYNKQYDKNTYLKKNW